MKKFFVYVVLPLLLVMVLGVALLQIDDPLDPDAEALVALTLPTAESEAYLYLLGFDAPAGESPLELGQTLLAGIREIERQIANSPLMEHDVTLPSYDGLPRLEGELACQWHHERCPAQVVATAQAQLVWSAEQEMLFQRYQHFLALEDYQSQSLPLLNEYLPPFGHLLSGQRLTTLKALQLADAGKPDKAVALLADNLQKIRHQQQRADDLVGKMVLLAALSESLDTLSLLLVNHGYDLAPPLPSFSAAERDFTSPIAREFAMGYYMFASMDRHPQFFSTNEEVVEAPGWLVRAVFKPNMSINGSLGWYQQVIALSQLSPLDFANHMQDFEPAMPPSHWLRNATGSILLTIARARLQDYVAAGFQAHGKIDLLQQLIALGGVPETLQPLNSPFSTSEDALYWSEDRQRLCLKMPGTAEQRWGHCLLVNVTPAPVPQAE
ncbi:MAG: hypothetical protein LAT63_08090 [Marinobacter sp.]|nr:hypothetical protein [Marinobacter sp.]